MEFLLKYWDSLLVVVLVIIAGIILFRKDKKLLYRILVYLCTQAEKYITGDKVGVERFDDVITKIYCWVPDVLKWFISRELMKIQIEKALKNAKKLWEEHPELLDKNTDATAIMDLVE